MEKLKQFLFENKKRIDDFKFALIQRIGSITKDDIGFELDDSGKIIVTCMVLLPKEVEQVNELFNNYFPNIN